MAAWLVQLRSCLLLPADVPEQQKAAAEADQLRHRLVDLHAMQVLARWLDDRPQLGRDVFTRDCPEGLAAAIGGAPAVDVVAFLWASLAMFDDASDAVDTTAVYRPRRWELVLDPGGACPHPPFAHDGAGRRAFRAVPAGHAPRGRRWWTDKFTKPAPPGLGHDLHRQPGTGKTRRSYPGAG